MPPKAGREACVTNMTRSIIASFLAGFLAIPAMPQEPASTSKGGIAKFSTTRQLVVVDVTAKDKDGKPIKGLKPADFAISADGKKQNIPVFEYKELEETVAARAPVPAIKNPAAEVKADAPAVMSLTANQIAPSKPGEVRY